MVRLLAEFGVQFVPGLARRSYLITDSTGKTYAIQQIALGNLKTAKVADRKQRRMLHFLAVACWNGMAQYL